MSEGGGFKVGDIVEAFGTRGVVETFYTWKSLYCKVLRVKFFESGEVIEFYIDGKLEKWNKEPALKLIERKKNKIKKELKVRVHEDFLERVRLGDTLKRCDWFSCDPYPEDDPRWNATLTIEVEVEE